MNDDIPGGSDQLWPNLVVYDDAGSTIVVVSWNDKRGADDQLRTATSSDGGVTFGPSVGVSSHTDASSLMGNLDVDGGGRVYAAWSRFDGSCYAYVWFSYSDDNGASWSTMTPLYAGQCDTEPAHVVAGGPDSVMVFFSEEQSTHKNIIALYSTDGSTSFGFGSVTNYSVNQSITEYMSSTVDLSGRLHLAFTYAEMLGSITKINYVTSSNWGLSWTTPVPVNDVNDLFTPPSLDDAQVPAIGVAPFSDAIYVAWADERAADGDLNVYLTRSTDGGSTWDTDVMVNQLQTPLHQGHVSLGVRDIGGGFSYVLVTWNDDRNGVGIPEVGPFADLSIHPIPATDRLTIDLPNTTFGPVHYEVLDARGSMIHAGTWNMGGSQIIDVSALSAGLHMVRLVSTEQTVTIPWIKE